MNSIKNEFNKRPLKNETNEAISWNVKKTKSTEIEAEILPTLGSIDEDSSKGRFGWVQIMSSDLPYIFRSEKKYICYKILEQRVFSKLFYQFFKELVGCTGVGYVYATQVEAELLNHINVYHCNFQFGKDKFTPSDLLLDLQDAKHLVNFLHTCYVKLESLVDPNASKRCGFVRINKESIVPYSIVNKFKCVPLFYFEGETDDLKQYTIKMEGWEMAYLKFCCKIQGIRNDLINSKTSKVINLHTLKSFFPPNTLFEEFWPARRDSKKDYRQKGEGSSQITLNSIYDMTLNALATPVEKKQTFIQQPILPKSPSKTKRLAIQPKLINIRNDPAAPNYQAPSNQVSVTHEYMSNSYSVYKLQHVLLDNKLIVCINMKPNDINDRWIAVLDLSTDFFYRVPINICESVMNVLGIEIYKANTAQMRILRTTGRYNTNEVLSMVQLTKIIQHLPQINYMIRNIITKANFSG